MGFARKALFVSTGGLSGAVGIKANSKKERTAKAAEKQLKVRRQMAAGQQQRPMPSPPRPTASVTSELERLGELHRQGVLTDDEFSAAKARLLTS